MERDHRAPQPDEDRIAASDSESDGRLRYGGSWFSAATALPLDGALTQPRVVAALVAEAVRRPRRLAALIALLMRTPREHVVLSGSPAGQAIDRYFNQRRLGILKNRLCRGVLLLPADHADYLRGRRRHALRTNLRKAATAGIRCEVVTDSRRARSEVSAVLRRQWGHLPEAELYAWTNHFGARVTRPGMTVTVARDQAGDALAALAATIDESVCAIGFALATCHEARWALHDHLVRILIARRVRYLFAADEGPFGALGYPANVQHYQHLLGYELRHVIPVRTRRAPRRRRVVASLVVAAASVAAIVPRAVADTAVPAPVKRTTPHHAVRSAPARLVSRASANP